MMGLVVAGHICLDILPDMERVPIRQLATPGALFEVGNLRFIPGGAVTNVGLAAYRLGALPALIATLGDDMIGQLIRAELSKTVPNLNTTFRLQAGQQSSYTIVLSPENADRIFLHCEGTNEHFDMDDIPYEVLEGNQVFHLGYPPVLPQLLPDNGQKLAQLFEKAKTYPVTTAMDMSMPDLNQPDAYYDWQKILQRTLPFVDVFLPSIEEILIMMRYADYTRWGRSYLQKLTTSYLTDLAQELLAMGSAVVGFKLGEHGLFACATDDPHRLEQAHLNLAGWLGETSYHPAFAVKIAGTTGAGDAAYAGFLMALMRGQPLAKAVALACGVGSAVVEAPSGIQSLPHFDDIRRRIDRGWPKHDARF
jgi:sugar/nucleoside kinase (ribokinase family)